MCGGEMQRARAMSSSEQVLVREHAALLDEH
jgi:hypothetical protein